MNKILKSSLVSAQVLNVDFVASENSYVVNCVSPLSDGGYKVHDPIWTNSAQQPVFTAGQSVNLIPETYTNKKKKRVTKFHILPA